MGLAKSRKSYDSVPWLVGKKNLRNPRGIPREISHVLIGAREFHTEVIYDWLIIVIGVKYL
jgi:hypothetical protein